jgi:hypothetical protein
MSSGLKTLAAHRFGGTGSIRRLLPHLVAALMLGLGLSPDVATANNLNRQNGNAFLAKVQANGRAVPPRAMVLRGPSPEAERVAAVLAASGLFDVFIAPLEDGWADTGARVDFDTSDGCRSGYPTLSPDAVSLECLHRSQPELLPGCSLQIDLIGPSGSESVAQRARIYVVLNRGESCPFYDQRYSAYDLRMNGMRPWSSSQLLAELASPTLQQILRAIGVQPSERGR